MRVGLASFLAVSFLASAAAAQDTAGLVYVQVPHMALREKPDLKARQVGTVDIGLGCEQTAEAGSGWVAVTCEDVKGFARKTSVGPKEPDGKALAAIAADGKRTIAQRYSAARKVLALEFNAGALAKPGSAGRAAFRERFLDRAFDRLVSRRAAKKLMASPIVTERPDKDVDAAITAAVTGAPLTRHGQILASKVSRRGTDFVLTALVSTGRLFVVSGRVAAGQGGGATVTIELRAASDAPKEVFVALLDPVAELPDTCASQPATAEGEAICAVAYEQNCSPDTCWEPFQDCKLASGRACSGCVEQCGDACRTCHAGCVGKTGPCVTTCLTAAKGCGKACEKTTTKAAARCDKTYNTCSKKAEKWADANCPGFCKKLDQCTAKECRPGQDDTECYSMCREKYPIPFECSDRCGF